MFLNISIDSFKKILIYSFEDFLVDQDKTVSEYPDLKIDSFRFFGHIFTPVFITWWEMEMTAWFLTTSSSPPPRPPDQR